MRCCLPPHADYVPPTWINIASVKQTLYAAVADRHAAEAQLGDLPPGSANPTASFMGAHAL
jgi:hypothetical protein